MTQELNFKRNEKRNILVKKVLHKLTPREEKVIKMYLGIDDTPSSISAIAFYFDVENERVNQILVKAFKKIVFYIAEYLELKDSIYNYTSVE